MRYSILLSLFLVACGPAETWLNRTSTISTPTPEPIASYNAYDAPPMVPVKPAIKLSSRQYKYLNDSLPPDVRGLMESAEEFFVLAEEGPRERTESELTTFQPNRIASVTDREQRKRLLESFYADAAESDGAANCWEPHHALRAIEDGQTIEIEICFDCAKFSGSGKLRSVEGTIVREGRRSEKLFEHIVKNQSIELEK